MYQFYIAVVLVAAFANAEEEPFSIGLGVLSPSYTQTVGKENVKVNFEQKDNGFSYSVGDPTSGTKSFLNFGSAAAYADISPSGYAGPSQSAYGGAGPSQSAYGGAGPSQSAYGGAAASQSAYAGAGPSQSAYGGAGASQSAYAGAGPSQAAYAGAGPSQSAYAGPNPSAYTGPASSGYEAPQANPAYNGFAGYQQPSLGGNLGYGAGGFGSGNAYGVSSGPSGQYNHQAAAPVAPSGYQGESARKPEEPAQILPAGFSYHGTEGQSFLRQGDSPNFLVSDENQESARGPAEQSFHDNFRASGPQGSRKVLVNGLVGYGPGGQRGSLPVGGYAGPQAGGLFKDHGGHA